MGARWTWGHRPRRPQSTQRVRHRDRRCHTVTVMPESLPVPVMALFARWGGAASCRDLLTVDATDNDLERWVRNGLIVRVGRGQHVSPPGELPPDKYARASGCVRGEPLSASTCCGKTSASWVRRTDASSTRTPPWSPRRPCGMRSDDRSGWRTSGYWSSDGPLTRSPAVPTTSSSGGAACARVDASIPGGGHLRSSHGSPGSLPEWSRPGRSSGEMSGLMPGRLHWASAVLADPGVHGDRRGGTSVDGAGRPELGDGQHHVAGVPRTR